MKRLVLIILACAGLTGCAQQVRRSALVPPITPPMTRGRPVDNGLSELSFGNATFLAKSTPVDIGNDSNAGLHIPRTQFGLQALFRVGRDFSLGAKIEIGLSQGPSPSPTTSRPLRTARWWGSGRCSSTPSRSTSTSASASAWRPC